GPARPAAGSAPAAPHHAAGTPGTRSPAARVRATVRDGGNAAPSGWTPRSARQARRSACTPLETLTLRQGQSPALTTRDSPLPGPGERGPADLGQPRHLGDPLRRVGRQLLHRLGRGLARVPASRLVVRGGLAVVVDHRSAL